ncbi:MAG: 1,4-dihydroxy-6-naphthoate synthase [Chitinophagaceae bacterium]|nr:1,4-dihydroxy-6-naphthoate synthase [Chitinophagaceae bacterium]
MKNITLGFSPCPNDTFIFDALVNKKIDTGDLDFNIVLEDVETLNEMALKNSLDVTKISYGVLPLVLKDYILLNSGGALGTGVGPLLISKYDTPIDDIHHCTIAIPGEYTTAHMLFALAFPNARNKIFLRYNEIEDYVLNSPSQETSNMENQHTGAVDPKMLRLGVIIHENRFTYHLKGLKKISDLGEFWESETGYPIPLGGIVAKRTLDTGLQRTMDDLIKQSIQYAFSNYPYLPEFVKNNSQEMEETVMRKHIDLYVNDFSVQLGDDGKNAVREFLQIYESINPLYKKTVNEIFV